LGCGGEVEAHFVQQAFLFPTPEPYPQQKLKIRNKNKRGEEGKTAHNTKPQTTRECESEGDRTKK